MLLDSVDPSQPVWNGTTYQQNSLWIGKEFFKDIPARFTFGNNGELSVPVYDALENRDLFLVAPQNRSKDFKILGVLRRLELLNYDLSRPHLVYNPLIFQSNSITYCHESRETMLPLETNGRVWALALTNPFFRKDNKHIDDLELTLRLPKNLHISKLCCKN